LYPVAAAVQPTAWACLGIVGFDYNTTAISISVYLTETAKTTTYVQLNFSSS
jgi:hypothetical protein